MDCTRELHSGGLITSDEANIRETINYFYKRRLDVKYGLNMSILLGSLRKMNIIYPKVNEDTVMFKPGKLELILNRKDAYIEKTSNSVIVGQEIGFNDKTPKTWKCCNKTFESQQAFQQHRRDKIHSKQVKSQKGETRLIAECEPGNKNRPETIMQPTASFPFEVTLQNVSKEDLILKKITAINPILKDKLAFPPIVGIQVPPSKKVILTIVATLGKRRSFSSPLSIEFTSLKTATTHNIVKDITFEIVANEFRNLLPTSPYERQERIAKRMDETIVPGEKPVFTGNFVFAVSLQQYPLTPTYIKVFNTGLEKAMSDTKAESLRVRIKNLLNVENPANCLTAQNYGEMLDLFLYLEEHQMNVDILAYNCQRALKHCVGNLYDLEVPDLADNRPSLIVGDSVYIKEPGASIKYEGKVHEKHLSSVRLGFDKKFASIFIAGKQFEVSFGFNRTTLKIEHQAVKLLANYAKYFFPQEIPDFITSQSVHLNLFNKELQNNQEQQTAVKNIAAGSSGQVPYLIFGPPGTGKTMTVVESILQIRKQLPNKRILVCAPSNSAANLLASRLLKFRSMGVNELLRYVSMSCSVADIPPEVRKYSNVDASGIANHPTLEKLMKYAIVITTLITAGRLYNIGVPKEHFHAVFIDESGHSTESETLIPITATLIDAGQIKGQIVLAGDPKQLGPIIHSSIAKKYGYGTSMLERLMNTNTIYQKHDGSYDNRVLTKLLNNYRSHPEIIKLPNEEFYEGELKSLGNPMTTLAIGDNILPNPNFPIIFHNVIGVDKREGKSPSFFNIQEIAVVKEYMKQLVGKRLKGTKIAEKDIAIITPYHKQAQKLRNALQMFPTNPNSAVIGTVEKLQGQERLIVIISTVRSKPEYVEHDMKFHLGFLRNPKRFNVALTRAKALLIVIGNAELLKYDEYWMKFIQRCKDNKAVKGPTFSLDLHEDEAALINGFEKLDVKDISDSMINATENHSFRAPE